MAKITSSDKSGSFVYDFATNLGAIGSINMGVFLPDNAVVWFGYTKVITTFTSGGAATIAIGFAGTTAAFLAPVAYTSLTAAAILPGVNLPAAPVEMIGTTQLQLTIAGATVTAGKLVFYYNYTEWPL